MDGNLEAHVKVLIDSRCWSGCSDLVVARILMGRWGLFQYPDWGERAIERDGERERGRVAVRASLI